MIMNKVMGYLLIGASIITAAFTLEINKWRSVPQKVIQPGEFMKYRVHYGFINAGEATMAISDDIHIMNGRPCYKVDVKGNSTGLFDMITRVRDNWGTYLDTQAIVSQRFYQSIAEGRYRKKEIIDFDHQNKKAIVHRLDDHTGELIKKVDFEIPKYVQDIVSGYYYLRTFDFDTLDANEIFQLKGFYDDTTYHLNVQYLGTKKLKTKVGEYESIVISPIMPKNSFFSGKNPVKGYISNDEKKIPLKVKAELLIGSIEIDIPEYRSGGK
jgi:hypothetical protein